MRVGSKLWLYVLEGVLHDTLRSYPLGPYERFINRSYDFLFLRVPQKSWTAWLGQWTVLRLLREKRRRGKKTGPFGRGVGGPTAMALATRWHHRPLWLQLLQGSPNPWIPDQTPPQKGQSFPHRLCPEPLGPMSLGSPQHLPNTRLCPQFGPKEECQAG